VLLSCLASCCVLLQLAGRVSFSYQGSDFVRPISDAAEDMQGLRLSEQELAMYLDLGPYSNPSYYVVQVGFHLPGLQQLYMYIIATPVDGRCALPVSVMSQALNKH
jgi:hypothetical protein